MLVKTRKLLAVLLAGVLAFSFTGLVACTQEPVEEPVQAEPEEQMRTIGTPSEDAIEIIVENGTKKDIVSFAAKTSTEEEFGSSLISSREKIEAGEKVRLYIPAEEVDVEDTTSNDTTESTSNAGNEEEEGNIQPLLRTLYDVSLGFDDDTSAELHTINILELSEVKICLTKDGIAYIEYQNEDGKTESTLETEKALIEEKEAAAQAEAEAAAAQAEAEAQAQAEAEAAAAAASQYSYDYGTGGSSGSTGSQSEDVCVPESDLVFN